MTIIAGVLAALALAFANGANDVSKGIATLTGAGLASPGRAVLWGALWTLAGGLAAAAAGGALVATFGTALLAPGVTVSPSAAVAVALGAAACVLLATRIGLPVSTTHALVGALVGVGLLAYGSTGLRWDVLTSKIAAPLLLSPLVAALLAGVLFAAWGRLTDGDAAAADCLCATVEEPLPVAGGVASSAVAAPASRLGLRADAAERCEADASTAALVRLDRLHWLSSAATSFARGLQDGAKMTAVVLPVLALNGGAGPWLGFALVAGAMTAGSLVAGLPVTRFLGGRVTALDRGDGSVANLVTAGLVIAGAAGGLPMSTTHVASGAIVGVGAARGGSRVDWGAVGQAAWAWLLTLPLGAILGAGSFVALVRVAGGL